MHTCMHTHTVHLREEQKRQNPTEERKRFPRKRTALHGHGACDSELVSTAPRAPLPATTQTFHTVFPWAC